MPNLNRRDFLKALGVTSGASALSACGLDNNLYKSPVEQILPYVVKPEQVTPGTYTFFATSVLKGPHASAVTARHRDGRVTTLSANFQASSKPSVSVSSLLELQLHYSPDRITGPRKGDAAIGWDEGLKALSSAMSAASGAGKAVAYLGAYRSGPIVELLRDVTGGRAIFWEPTGYAALADAVEGLFGTRVLPFYDVEKADFVLSFGAPFLGGWGDGGLEARYAAARNPNVGHAVARFSLVAPYRDQTGANADDWHAVKPGSEVLVARALAAALATDPAVKAAAGGTTLDEAAAASGLDKAALEALVAQLKASKAVVLPGGTSGSKDLAAATLLLNQAIGAMPERVHLGGYAGPVHGDADLRQLAADLDAGRVGVLLVEGANPAGHLPADHPLHAALGKADLVVSLGSHPDATSKLAGMVLPVSDTLEDWGAENPVAGTWLLRQPAMSPLHDTRSLGDVLLAAARDAALAAPVDEAGAAVGLGFGPRTWRDYLTAWWRANAWDGSGDFVASWEQSLLRGELVRAVEAPAASLVGSWSFGDAKVYDQAVIAVDHAFVKDGRYANAPWGREVGDPLTGNVWGTWVEISEAKAAELGVARNDVVTIATDAGALDLAVHPRRGIHDSVALVHFGGGHEASGRYAAFGKNVVALLSAASGGLAIASAKLSKGAGTGDLVTTFTTATTSAEGRHFGVVVNADKLAKVGDAPAHHAGELTGIHHLELDKRLLERNFTTFYPEPQHPNYRFGLTVDTNACNGCGACSIACYAENNLPIVGRQKVAEGREMAWLRINRYWESDVGGHDDVRFMPMMCQHCGHAGCENVCPVLATYHNIDGLNAMVYNRCVGTRYCSNACPFSARRFNYHTYKWPDSLALQLNPDVMVRTMGVMEKCTFCVQRLRQTKSAYKDGGNFTAKVPSEAWEQVPACVEACPSQAMVFGNLNDAEAKVATAKKSGRAYWPLDELNVHSAVTYLAKANFHVDPTAHHGGGHDGDHAGEHADADGHEMGDQSHSDKAHGGDHGAAANAHGEGGSHGGDHAAAGAHGEEQAAPKAGHDGDHEAASHEAGAH